MSDDNLKPLWQAVKDGNLEACKRLVAEGVLPKQSTWRFWKKISLRYMRDGGKIDCNPFHLAACLGHLEICKLLVESGADVNECNDNRKLTALHYAAIYGHPDVCRWLVKMGARINARSSLKKTPLHLAKNEDVVAVLLECGADLA